MEKYSTLKTLAGVLNFIAWLNLIAGIIIAIYSNSENLGTIMIVSSIVSGLIGFVLLLSFGELIQLALDIRENQISTEGKIITNDAESERKIIINDTGSEGSTNNSEIKFSETTLLDLKKLILIQKQSILGEGKNEILELLSRLITTKQKALDISVAYEKYFGVDIIDELKSLSNNYGTIREYLEQFIDFEIVEKEYPHKMI